MRCTARRKGLSMNELLLIEMMSELDPGLLENDYIEKDMNREKVTFFKRLFSSKKKSKQEHKNFFGNFILEDMESNLQFNDVLEETEQIEIIDKIDEKVDEIDGMPKLEDYNNLGFSVSIFRRKIHNLVKIISGIIAAFLVMIGIILIIINRHKSGIKLYEKKIQIIY